MWRCERCSADYVPVGTQLSDRGLTTRDRVVCAVCLRPAGNFLPVERWTISPAPVRWTACPGETDYPLVLVKPWDPAL